MSKIHEIKAVWCLSFRAGFLGNSNSRIPYRTEGAGMVLPQVAPGVFAFCAVASFFSAHCVHLRCGIFGFYTVKHLITQSSNRSGKQWRCYFAIYSCAPDQERKKLVVQRQKWVSSYNSELYI